MKKILCLLLLPIFFFSCIENEDFDDEESDSVIITPLERLGLAHTSLYVRPTNSLLISYSVQAVGYTGLAMVVSIFRWNGTYFNEINTFNGGTITQIETDACKIVYTNEGVIKSIQKKKEGAVSDFYYIDYVGRVSFERLELNNNTLRISGDLYGESDWLFRWENQIFTKSNQSYNNNNINKLKSGEFCFMEE